MANQKTDLTSSHIKYMLVMYNLCKVSGEIHCVRVAEALGVSKPSVHKMINKLKNMNLVKKSPYGTVSFTETGRKFAKQYSEYFEVLCAWFATILQNSTDIRLAVCAVLAEMSTEHLEEMCAYCSAHMVR